MSLLLDPQGNLDAIPEETVVPFTEIPEPETEAKWLTDNLPFCLSDQQSETTVNKDYSYQGVIPEIKIEDFDELMEKSRFESSAPLAVVG